MTAAYKRQLLAVAVLIAVSGLAATVEWRAANSARGLVANSTLVADASAWLSLTTWTDQNNVTALTTSKAGVAVCTPAAAHRSSTVVPVGALLLKRLIDCERALLSPDGRRVLIVRTGPGSPYDGQLAMMRSLSGAWVVYEIRTIGSSLVVSYRADGRYVYNVAWLNDGSGFVATEGAGDHINAVERFVDRRHPPVTRTLPGPPYAPYLAADAVDDTHIVTSSATEGANEMGHDPTHVDVTLSSLRQPDLAAEQLTLTAPRSADESYVVASHSGRRLAWVLTYTVKRLAIRWGHGLPSLRWAAQQYRGIWVGDIGGTSSRFLGSEAYGPHHYPVLSVQWLPGDKRISFLARKRLWTIPVD